MAGLVDKMAWCLYAWRMPASWSTLFIDRMKTADQSGGRGAPYIESILLLCRCQTDAAGQELDMYCQSGHATASLGLKVNAGHGLTYQRADCCAAGKSS